MTGDEKPNSIPLTAHLVVLMSPVCDAVDRGDQSELVALEILVAVRHEHVVAANDRRRC